MIGLIIGKSIVSFALIVYCLMNAVWPINEKNTSTKWKIGWAVFCLIALTLLWSS